MAGTVVTGNVGTEEFLPDEKQIDMDETIRKLRPDETQFTTMTDKTPSKVAVREKVNWLEEDDFPRLATTAGAVTSGATSITVSAGQGKLFQVNDIFRNVRTGESEMVTAIATDTLTVAHIGSVAAAAMNSGDVLLIIGDAQPQGSNFPVMRYLQRVLGYNYTEITRTPWQFTNTATAINLYGANEPGKEAVRKAREHKRKWEAIGFFGARSFAATGPGPAPDNDPQGTAGGLLEFIQTNVLDNGGAAITPDAFDAFLSKVYAWGSTDKVLFAGPQLVASMSKWNRTGMGSQFVAPENGTVHGVKIDAFISGAYGYRLPVIVKKEWAEFGVATASIPTYSGSGFIVDMSNVSRRPLQGRDTKLLTDQQTKGKDTYAAEYICEASYEIAQEKTHGYIKNCI